MKHCIEHGYIGIGLNLHGERGIEPTTPQLCNTFYTGYIRGLLNTL